LASLPLCVGGLVLVFFGAGFSFHGGSPLAWAMIVAGLGCVVVAIVLATVSTVLGTIAWSKHKQAAPWIILEAVAIAGAVIVFANEIREAIQ
jgi:hypothetical protein